MHRRHSQARIIEGRPAADLQAALRFRVGRPLATIAGLVAGLVLVAGLALSPALAQGKGKKPAANQPKLVVTHGEWGVYVAQAGKAKTCYALGRPKKRAPANLKRDDGFIFVTSRPGEGVRGEISIILGYDAKEDAAPNVQIGPAKFEMHAKGSNLWVKNAAEERNFIAAMRKGSELSVSATSKRGNKTTDTYSLSGISQALDRVLAECK